MVVRASAVASISGSYNVRAHALSRTHFVKLGGAWRGSLLSPAARKLLRLSLKGSWFWFITLWQNSAGAASIPRAAGFHLGAAILPAIRFPTRIISPVARHLAREFLATSWHEICASIPLSAKCRCHVLFSRRPEDVIPKRRTHPVSGVI